MPTIRLATAEDAAAVAAIYAPVVRDTATSFETVPPDAETMRGRIEDTLPAHPWLVCERDGGVIGYAYAGDHRSRDAYRWAVDASVYVHPDHRRSGVGRGLYESLFAVLRLQGFHNAYAGITLPNPASVGLHESLGFERVGVYESVGYKNGAWHDVGWWHRRLRTPERDPASPRGVDALRGRRGFDEAIATGRRSIRVT